MNQGKANMNGCNTTHPKFIPRTESYWAQDGFYPEANGRPMMPHYIRVADRMSKNCKYDRYNIDPGCANCTNKPKGGNKCQE